MTLKKTAIVLSFSLLLFSFLKCEGFGQSWQEQYAQSGNSLKLVISTTNTTIPENFCSAATITLNTASGEVRTTPQELSIILNSPASYYSDNNCSMAISAVTIAAGSNSQTFYFKFSLAGSYTIYVSATSVNEGSIALTIVSSTTAAANLPTGVTNIAFSGTANFDFDTCTAITINARDDVGNVVVDKDLIILLSHNTGSGGAFYSDASCLGVNATTTIATGTSSRVVYFKETAVTGPFTLFASAIGLPTANFAITISAV